MSPGRRPGDVYYISHDEELRLLQRNEGPQNINQHLSSPPHRRRRIDVRFGLKVGAGKRKILRALSQEVDALKARMSSTGAKDTVDLCNLEGVTGRRVSSVGVCWPFAEIAKPASFDRDGDFF